MFELESASYFQYVHLHSAQLVFDLEFMTRDDTSFDISVPLVAVSLVYFLFSL